MEAEGIRQARLERYSISFMKFILHFNIRKPNCQQQLNQMLQQMSSYIKNDWKLFIEILEFMFIDQLAMLQLMRQHGILDQLARLETYQLTFSIISYYIEHKLIQLFHSYSSHRNPLQLQLNSWMNSLDRIIRSWDDELNLSTYIQNYISSVVKLYAKIFICLNRAKQDTAERLINICKYYISKKQYYVADHFISNIVQLWKNNLGQPRSKNCKLKNKNSPYYKDKIQKSDTEIQKLKINSNLIVEQLFPVLTQQLLKQSFRLMENKPINCSRLKKIKKLMSQYVQILCIIATTSPRLLSNLYTHDGNKIVDIIFNIWTICKDHIEADQININYPNDESSAQLDDICNYLFMILQSLAEYTLAIGNTAEIDGAHSLILLIGRQLWNMYIQDNRLCHEHIVNKNVTNIIVLTIKLGSFFCNQPQSQIELSFSHQDIIQHNKKAVYNQFNGSHTYIIQKLLLPMCRSFLDQYNKLKDPQQIKLFIKNVLKPSRSVKDINQQEQTVINHIHIVQQPILFAYRTIIYNLCSVFHNLAHQIKKILIKSLQPHLVKYKLDSYICSSNSQQPGNHLQLRECLMLALLLNDELSKYEQWIQCMQQLQYKMVPMLEYHSPSNNQHSNEALIYVLLLLNYRVCMSDIYTNNSNIEICTICWINSYIIRTNKYNHNKNDNYRMDICIVSMLQILKHYYRHMHAHTGNKQKQQNNQQQNHIADHQQQLHQIIDLGIHYRTNPHVAQYSHNMLNFLMNNHNIDVNKLYKHMEHIGYVYLFNISSPDIQLTIMHIAQYMIKQPNNQHNSTPKQKCYTQLLQIVQRQLKYEQQQIVQASPSPSPNPDPSPNINLNLNLKKHIVQAVSTQCIKLMVVAPTMESTHILHAIIKQHVLFMVTWIRKYGQLNAHSRNDSSRYENNTINVDVVDALYAYMGICPSMNIQQDAYTTILQYIAHHLQCIVSANNLQLTTKCLVLLASILPICINIHNNIQTETEAETKSQQSQSEHVLKQQKIFIIRNSIYKILNLSVQHSAYRCRVGDIGHLYRGKLYILVLIVMGYSPYMYHQWYHNCYGSPTQGQDTQMGNDGTRQQHIQRMMMSICDGYNNYTIQHDIPMVLQLCQQYISQHINTPTNKPTQHNSMQMNRNEGDTHTGQGYGYVYGRKYVHLYLKLLLECMNRLYLHRQIASQGSSGEGYVDSQDDSGDDYSSDDDDDKCMHLQYSSHHKIMTDTLKQSVSISKCPQLHQLVQWYMHLMQSSAGKWAKDVIAKFIDEDTRNSIHKMCKQYNINNGKVNPNNRSRTIYTICKQL